MSNLKKELGEAKKRISELDADFIKALNEESVRSEAGRKRRIEDGKATEELLKNSNIDLSKFLEYDKTAAKKAEETLKEAELGLKNVPKEILSRAQDQIRIDEALIKKFFLVKPYPKWFSIDNYLSGSGNVQVHKQGGVAEGDCGMNIDQTGIITANSNEMKPKSLARGSGSGWSDDNTVTTTCWLWFLIPGSYITFAGTLYVWPYLDLHGLYQVYARDRAWNSKQAAIKLTMTTSLYGRQRFPYCTRYAEANWVVLDEDKDDIDKHDRVDFTGTQNLARASLLVYPGEPVSVKVKAELYSYAQGDGSHALLDFQWQSNAIRIPEILGFVW